MAHNSVQPRETPACDPVLRAVLPPVYQLVARSVRYVDGAQDVIQDDVPLFDGGGRLEGPLPPGGAFYYRFDTLLAPTNECLSTSRTIAIVRPKSQTEVTDHLDIELVDSARCTWPTSTKTERER